MVRMCVYVGGEGVRGTLKKRLRNAHKDTGILIFAGKFGIHLLQSRPP